MHNPYEFPNHFPSQHQDQEPGLESAMNPPPVFDLPNQTPGARLKGKVALISGGDSGIGRAVAVAFAKEGAKVAVAYLNEHQDAKAAQDAVQKYSSPCLVIAADLRQEPECQRAVQETVDTFGKLDILVNNAAEQHPQPGLEHISAAQLLQTFETNIFSYFFLAKAALTHLQPGSAIINTASITAYDGNKELLDYSATKGAVVSFTRSLSQSLIGRGIRVNGVAPGPIWTPLIPSTFTAGQVENFGSQAPMMRAGQPVEVAPAYVFLASEDASYMSGQMLHVNGGNIVNG